MDRVLLVITGLTNLVFVYLPFTIAVKLGLRKKPREASSPITKIAQNIYQISYFVGPFSSNATLLKGKDGTLLLHSPPPALGACPFHCSHLWALVPHSFLMPCRANSE
jgi:hypothetical protein